MSKSSQAHVMFKYIMEGKLNMLKASLKFCNIDATNDCGYTPLMIAILHDKLEIVEFLIKRGASTIKVNKYKENAKLIAKNCGNPEIIKLMNESLLSLVAKSTEENVKRYLKLGHKYTHEHILEVVLETYEAGKPKIGELILRNYN